MRGLGESFGSPFLLYKTKTIVFSYINVKMITLLPTTSAQEFNIIPRDYDAFQDLDLTITEDGTGTTESFTDITVFENGDYICVSQAFTILREEHTYYVSITSDGVNWWRGKVRCPSQTDRKVKHTLNSTTREQYSSVPSSEDYTEINS